MNLLNGTVFVHLNPNEQGDAEMKIAVIGSCMVDLMSYVDKVPVAGETKEVFDFSISCGGKGANQAIAAAKMGAGVIMLAKVGDDIFGDTTIENFKQHKIDTQFVQKVPNTPSGMATVIVDESSQNRILIHKGANNSLLPIDIDEASETLKECDLLLLQLEIPMETVAYAIAFANKNHIPVLLNPAPAVKDLNIDMVCKCDFFVPNETELEILTGMPVGSESEIKRAAQQLVHQGVKNVIVTMGSRGSMWLTQDEFYFFAAYKVDAKDATGAGDAFIGSFANDYVKTKDVRNAMKEASAFSAISVTKSGTQMSYPSKDEVKAFLERRQNI